jgi:hypothetical protein
VRLQPELLFVGAKARRLSLEAGRFDVKVALESTLKESRSGGLTGAQSLCYLTTSL